MSGFRNMWAVYHVHDLLSYTCVHLLVSAIVSNCSVHGYAHLKHARTLPVFSAYF